MGASGGGYPQTTDDVLAAFDALPNPSASLDLDRVTVVGHSAGGHLALWLAGHRRLAGVVSLAGVADLVAADEQHLGDDAVNDFLHGAAGSDHPEVDPAKLVPTGVPSLLVHGDADGNVPLDQSERTKRRRPPRATTATCCASTARTTSSSSTPRRRRGRRPGRSGRAAGVDAQSKVSTSRPRTPPASSVRWASAACSAGNVCATRSVTTPSSTRCRSVSSAS
ncbi:MAG: hypothetical protein QOJ32_1558 [Frankiaceae bacterium]|nr:hypothetical protein [Frankiaceae bacterium]